MNDLRQAAQQALEACEQRLPLNGQAAIIDELNNLRAALAEPEQEPVAWLHPGYMGEPTISRRLPEYGGGNQWEPLYTAPPQRKPLTDEEIVEILCKHFECVDDEYIKRAAQEIAAHNIKENT